MFSLFFASVTKAFANMRHSFYSYGFSMEVIRPLLRVSALSAVVSSVFAVFTPRFRGSFRVSIV
jgi:hypothetical protein